MAIAAPCAVQLGKHLHGATTPRTRARRSIRRLIHRLPGFLFVFATLVPLLVIAVFGSR
jgi:hypothetical protein